MSSNVKRAKVKRGEKIEAKKRLKEKNVINGTYFFPVRRKTPIKQKGGEGGEIKY